MRVLSESLCRRCVLHVSIVVQASYLQHDILRSLHYARDTFLASGFILIFYIKPFL